MTDPKIPVRNDIMQPEAGTGSRSIVMVLSGLAAGGTEHVVNMLATTWSRGGHHVTVISPDNPDTPSYYGYPEGILLVRLGVPSRREFPLRAFLSTGRRLARLRKAIKAAEPDIVLSFLTRMNVLTLLATRGLEIPVIVSERNNPAVQKVGFLWNWLRAKLYPLAFGHVTMTAAARDYFSEAIRAKTRVIPNAVDLPSHWTPRRGGNLLVAVGRLVQMKGFDMLLEAFAEIAPRFPDWKLIIWGEGPLRKQLEAQRDRLGLQSQVLMPGVTERPGMWIETADVFVLSSRYEGWGLVVLEAMAAGIPVVAFPCDFGPREMIVDGIDGLFARREDPRDLANKLSLVLTDAGLRQRMGQAAKRSVERFAPDKVISLWDEIVAAALATSSRAAKIERAVARPRAYR